MTRLTLSGAVCLLGIACASSAGPPDGSPDATSCARLAPPALVDAGGLAGAQDAAQARPDVYGQKPGDLSPRDAAGDLCVDAYAVNDLIRRVELGADLVELEHDAGELDAGASCPAGYQVTALACGGPGDKRFPCNGAPYDGGPGDGWCPCKYGPGICGGGIVCCAE